MVQNLVRPFLVNWFFKNWMRGDGEGDAGIYKLGVLELDYIFGLAKISSTLWNAWYFGAKQ